LTLTQELGKRGRFAKVSQYYISKKGATFVYKVIIYGAG